MVLIELHNLESRRRGKGVCNSNIHNDWLECVSRFQSTWSFKSFTTTLGLCSKVIITLLANFKKKKKKMPDP